jgi:hypothetical protein
MVITKKASLYKVFSCGGWPFFKGGEIMNGFYITKL